MKYIVRSIATHSFRLEVYFWICPKPLAGFGTRDFCSNLNFLESVENCSIFLIGFKGYLLTGQESSWLPIKAGVPQRSNHGPLLFLIYINYLPDELSSIAKLFADDTTLFSIVQDLNESAKYLNFDLTFFP